MAGVCKRTAAMVVGDPMKPPMRGPSSAKPTWKR